MSLPDLLQWAGNSGKTGTLELEREGVRKRIHFRRGRVTSCSSDDPPTLLGQFLLSRGKITRTQLKDGLARQQARGEKLGTILIDTGALTNDELARQIAAKAEETIFGLFDWPDASFRFIEEAAPDPYGIEVDLRVEDVLLHGLKRHDEMTRLRETFPDRDAVLRRTERGLPTEIVGRPAARAIVESIDGRKTIGEVLLHAHATEYVALRFLFQLLRGGLIEVAPTAEDATRGAPPRPGGGASAPAAMRAAPRGASTVAVAEAVAASVATTVPQAATRMEEALRLLSSGDPDGALALLQSVQRELPVGPLLRDLIGRAEAACRDAYLAAVPLASVPIKVDFAPERASAAEGFLFSLVDGRSDVRSILWVAPLRELDALRALRDLVARGAIRLR